MNRGQPRSFTRVAKRNPWKCRGRRTRIAGSSPCRWPRPQTPAHLRLLHQPSCPSLDHVLCSGRDERNASGRGRDYSSSCWSRAAAWTISHEAAGPCDLARVAVHGVVGSLVLRICLKSVCASKRSRELPSDAADLYRNTLHGQADRSISITMADPLRCSRRRL